MNSVLPPPMSRANTSVTPIGKPERIPNIVRLASSSPEISSTCKANFALYAIKKLISVLSITNCARRDGRRSFDMRSIDDLPPLPEALEHTIHGLKAQPSSV